MAEAQDSTMRAGMHRLLAVAPARITDKLVADGACVLWTGAVSRNGYGVVWFEGRLFPAHRLAYLLAHGTLDPALDVMHACDRRACVNPEHLSMGTRQQNMDDCVRKGRHAAGEKNGQARLSAHAVRAIRQLVASGVTQKAVASQYGIARSTVCQIVHGHRWKSGAEARGVRT